MSNCQLPAFTQRGRVRDAREKALQFKGFFSFSFFRSQPLTLPQQCVGECLTPSLLNTKQHEAVSADICAVNTPPHGWDQEIRGGCQAGLGAWPAAPHTHGLQLDAEEGCSLASAALSWPSRWELHSPLSFLFVLVNIHWFIWKHQVFVAAGRIWLPDWG